MNRFGFFIAIILMTLSCREDSGEFIFEMPFQGIEFELPAGLSTFNSYVQEFELDSNIDFFLSSNSTDTASITAFNPAFARIQALDNGVDFEYIREISIRICPVGEAPCTLVDEVFFIDSFTPLFGDRIDLLPSLRNAKRDLVEDKFKMEIVFNLNFISPYAVNNRLDLRFDAVR